MHAVVETPTYLSDAKSAGMDESEREQVVLFVSANPYSGDLMPGTGGAREVRFRRRGTGKSGGYRVIFYVADQNVPVFLLGVFTKGERANLSKAEQNTLRTILSKLVRLTMEETRS